MLDGSDLFFSFLLPHFSSSSECSSPATATSSRPEATSTPEVHILGVALGSFGEARRMGDSNTLASSNGNESFVLWQRNSKVAAARGNDQQGDMSSFFPSKLIGSMVFPSMRRNDKESFNSKALHKSVPARAPRQQQTGSLAVLQLLSLAYQQGDGPPK